MKTRIKIVYLKDGTIQYYPQYKFLCFWKYFSSSYAWKGNKEWFYYLSDAKDYISTKLKEIQELDGAKTIKTEYINYL